MADYPGYIIPIPAPLFATPTTYSATVVGEGGASPPTPTTTYYSLAAYDSTSRRYWTSTTIDFASAPVPVGAWNVGTLTVLASWT